MLFPRRWTTSARLDKQILVERHLISREHAAKKFRQRSCLETMAQETFCVMINEEDHLRMQDVAPRSLQLTPGLGRD